MEDKKKTKKKVGRPQFEPTDEQRKMVKTLAGVGVPQEQIAAIIGITDDTLRKHFEVETQVGKAMAHSNMAQAIYQKAIKGSERMMIFFAKTQMKWKETDALEVTGKDGGPLKIEQEYKQSLAKLLAGIKPEEDEEE